MYLDYTTYAALSADPIAEEDFTSSEAWAAAVLDNWTLNRLETVNWSPWSGKVAVVMTRLIDSRGAILAGDAGAALDSFSNGVDTYHFADPTVNPELKGCYEYAADLLPVELMSACVHYNGAH